MTKKELIEIIQKENVLQDIDCGPTVLVVSKGKKDIQIRVVKKESYLNITIGKILKRKFRIPISEI